jgi:deoxyribonuclease V
MQIEKLHDWNLSYSQARELQKKLASKVEFTPMKEMPKLIAGLDCALSKNKHEIFAAVVVLQMPDQQEGLWGPLESPGFEVVETATASQELTFPYIPGLLSFREAPVCLAAVEKLTSQPDAFIIDGQGIAHPRRFGLAAHLGLFFDKPTIGCAKSRLTGTFKEPPSEQGKYRLLMDRTIARREAGPRSASAEQEVIGAVVRTKRCVKPVFVSVGNKCLLKDAIKITLTCTTKYRLPEPTRLAHQAVGKISAE